ncbi:MAG: ArnT family glycosyltransferase, partial [Prochlorothrix sp.]
VPLLYCVGRQLFRHPHQAVYPAVVYLTLLPVVRHGRLAMLDGIVNTWMILLFLCLLKARKQPPWAVGIGLCLAAIALTKGILVLAIGAIAGLYVLLSHHWSLFRNPYAWLGLLLGTVLTGAWYGVQSQTYGPDFLAVHFGVQGFDRLGRAVEGNDGPVWYYLLEILKYGWPWLVFFPVGLKQAGQQWRTWGLFALLGFGVFLTVVSGMGTKLPWYLFPCYPFLAVIVGGYFATGQRPGQGYGYFFAFLTVATIAGGIYLGVTDPQLPLLITAALATLTFSTVARVLLHPQHEEWQGDRLFIPLAVGLYLSLASFFCSQAWVWEVNEQFPVQSIGTMLQAQTPPDAVIYMSHPDSRRSLEFYSDRPLIPTDLPTLQAQHLHHYLLVDTPTRDAIGPAMELATAEGFHLLAPQSTQQDDPSDP